MPNYMTNEFVVEIGTVESPSVTKVSGLSLGSIETIEVPDGGSNVIHKVPSGVVKFEPLIIERKVDGSLEDKIFQQFFNEMFKRGGRDVRRDGAIVKKHDKIEVFRITFFGAWVKSAKFSDLGGKEVDVLIQTITLEHDGLEWILP